MGQFMSCMVCPTKITATSLAQQGSTPHTGGICRCIHKGILQESIDAGRHQKRKLRRMTVWLKTKDDTRVLVNTTAYGHVLHSLPSACVSQVQKCFPSLVLLCENYYGTRHILLQWGAKITCFSLEIVYLGVFMRYGKDQYYCQFLLLYHQHQQQNNWYRGTMERTRSGVWRQ